MMKRPLTEQERKDLRELIDFLYQLTDEVKNPKNKLTGKQLHGGLFPFIGMLLALATRAIPLALQAARVAVPALLRSGVQLGARLLPSMARGATTIAQRAVGATQRGLLQAAQRSGVMRGAVSTGTRATGQTGRSLAGQSVKRGLINKVGTAMTLGAAGNVIADLNTGDIGYEDIDDGEQFYDDYRPPIVPTYAHEDDGGFTRQSAPDPDMEEVPDPEEDGTFNLAPLRYTPRVRNVFTAAQSRNPVSTARQTSAVIAPRGTAPVRARDIGVFRGSGVIRRKRVLKKYGLEDKGYSLAELAEITGVPESTLQEVYNRGIGAYKTNPRSVRLKVSFAKNVDAPMKQKLSKEQWAMARVYSFLDGNPKHDTDLRPVVIPKTEFVKEHTKLIDVLTKGSKKERLAEAKEQQTELRGKGKKKKVDPMDEIRAVDPDTPLTEKQWKVVMKGRTGVRERVFSLFPRMMTAEQFSEFAEKVEGMKGAVVDSDTTLVKVEPTDDGYKSFHYNEKGELTGEVETASKVGDRPTFAKKR